MAEQEKKLSKKIPFQIRQLQKHKEDFNYRRLKPAYVQWLCTDQCEFQCGHCSLTTGQSKGEPLSTKEMLKTIDTLSILGCEVFSITGGNPFIREDLFEVLQYAKKKGMKVSLTTHVNELEECKQQINELKVDSILFSVDGYRDKHDQIRGRAGDYEKALRCVHLSYERELPIIGVIITLLEENVHDIDKIIEDVFANGGNRIRIQPLLKKNQKNSPDTIKEALTQVYKARRMGFEIEMSEGFGYLGDLEPMVRSFSFFCGCGWDTFTIMPDGRIVGCPASECPNEAEGNIREADLKQIWFSRFLQFREDKLPNLPSKCSQCKFLQICRGGCWLFSAHKIDPCFLPQAMEVKMKIMG